MTVVSATYNRVVKSALLNRILIILGVIGIYIAGVLTIQHALQLEVPCTADGGCQTVARHASSYLPFGIGGMERIPVAYIGLAGYVLLTVLAILRSGLGKQSSPKWVGAGFFMAAAGMLFSLYLQYVSFTEIRAKCIWCISSAVIMTITFIIYAMLLNSSNSVSEEETAAGFSKEVVAGAIAFGLAFGAVGLTMKSQRQANIKIEIIKVDDITTLIPEKPNQLGDEKSVVTIVEFADLCCPACRTSISKVKEIKAKYGDKIRFIYRHFPVDRIAGHEMALVAAVAAEVAADKGKFWQFVEAFVATPEAVKTREEVFAIAASVNLDSDEIKKALEDGEHPANKRVIRDFSTALDPLKLTGTPQFFMYIKGEPVRKLNGQALMAELESEDVQKYLK
jgi:protein-disulfide isomerase